MPRPVRYARILIEALIPGVATAVLGVAPLGAQARGSGFRSEYTVEVRDTTTHLFHVTATFSNVRQPRLDLALPVWTPGWYTIENYGKNVLRFTVKDGSGARLPAPLSHAQTWSIDTRGTDRVVAEFDYLANVMALNQAKITDSFAFFTGTQLFLEPVGHRDAPATLRLIVPAGWRIVSALHETADSTVFTAANYDELVDGPTEMGALDVIRFEVEGKPHFLVLNPAGTLPADSLRQYRERLAAMIRAQSAIFGGLPYDKYVFFYILRSAESNAEGALEHLNSHVVLFGGSIRDFADALVGRPAHEFFHLWNVKRIRPAEMWPYDYSRPNETPSLWVSEGITSYYEDLTLYRAGLNPDTAFLNSIASAMGGIESNDARRYFSPSDASISTWLGYDTRTAFSISYYGQGEVLGALLDISIRRDTRGARGLDDVMRALYTQFYQRGNGFTPSDLVHVVSAVAGRDYAGFFGRYVTGVEVPPYDTILGYAGLRVERSEQTMGVLGAGAEAIPRGRVVRSIVPFSAAARAGLRTGDTLIAADGTPIGQVLLGRRSVGMALVGKAGQPVVFTISRGGQEQQLPVTFEPHRAVSFRIRLDSSAMPDQLAVRNAWLARGAPEGRRP